MASSDSAYEIFWDAAHLGDDPSDADLVKFPGWENVGGWQSTRQIAVPGRIFFEANLRSVGQIDFPLNNVAWPIMSRRMLDVLLRVRPFSHRTIPVTMLDDTVPTDRRLDDLGDPRPGVADERFAAVQLLEHADLIDWEQSEVLPRKSTSGGTQVITRVVLRESPGGLPPLFRLSANPSALFVSADARAALEAAHIHGVVYRPLEKVRL
jgi:hypothetical protein